jgi:hypothetical protein
MTTDKLELLIELRKLNNPKAYIDRSDNIESNIFFRDGQFRFLSGDVVDALRFDLGKSNWELVIPKEKKKIEFWKRMTDSGDETLSFYSDCGRRYLPGGESSRTGVYDYCEREKSGEPKIVEIEE